MIVTRGVLTATIASCLVVAAAVLGFTFGGSEASAPRVSAPRGPFAWLKQTSLPQGWTQLDGDSSVGPLPLPPRFHAVAGDRGTLTAVLFGRGGAYLGYLNATPRQGDERLQGWPNFRLEHLRDDDARSAREDTAAQLVRTGPALRSCVIDDYVTRVGHHHFHEVACLVVQNSAGSVIVAATPSGDPAHVWAVLQRAVAAYPAA
jgi:hypothetical protein